MTILLVKIIPKSKKNEMIGWQDDFLKIRIQAPAEKNKANEELIRFLSKILKIPQKDISIKKGKTTSKKLLYIKTKEPLSKKLNLQKKIEQQ